MKKRQFYEYQQCFNFDSVWRPILQLLLLNLHQVYVMSAEEIANAVNEKLVEVLPDVIPVVPLDVNNNVHPSLVIISLAIQLESQCQKG